MNHGIVSVCGWLVLLLAITVITGCRNEKEPAQGSTASSTGSDYPMDRDDERIDLRVRTDSARSRVWVLGLADVRVYDSATKKLLRQIALPSWIVARATCDPDLALDRSGSAFISSNAQPRIWRIDADSFEVKEHEIILQGKEQWDLGFGALAFAQDGTLLALSSPVGLLWSIDVDKASARMVEQNASFRDVCELTIQLVSAFEKSGKL